MRCDDSETRDESEDSYEMAIDDDDEIDNEDSDLADAIINEHSERERWAAISSAQLVISDEYELVHVVCPVNGILRHIVQSIHRFASIIMQICINHYANLPRSL